MDIIYLMKKELLRRKYSLNTIKTYDYCLKNFLNYCDKEPRRINKKDIKDYFDILMEKNVSGSTLNVNLSTLKFLMEEILNKNFMFKIKYSKMPKTLPIFLTKEEVIRLINSIENNKHKLMIKLVYSAGLRVSELVNLRVLDLDFNNNYGFVRHGKGNKDRLFIISSVLKRELLNYIRENNLKEDYFLFPSYSGHISTRSIQEIVKKATKKAKISKRIHPHTLRHSFATHLIENGYDVVSVQSLLGHNSAQTTMIYVHMASPNLINVKRPLDSLNLENSSSQLQEEYKKFDYEFQKTQEVGFVDEENNNLRI